MDSTERQTDPTASEPLRNSSIFELELSAIEGSGTNQAVLAESVLKEISGHSVKTGQMIAKIPELEADGSTASGCWIYAGVFAGGKNLSKRRDNKTDPSGLGIYPGFAWTWPGNMHILYNRASCDANGQPFDAGNKLIWWDEGEKKWKGFDTPDVPVPTDGPRDSERPETIPHERGRRCPADGGQLQGSRPEGQGPAAGQLRGPRRWSVPRIL